MNRVFALNGKILIGIFVFLDLLSVGMGMGVPIFTILFGFPLGWYIARRASLFQAGVHALLKQVLLWAVAASLFTFVLMCILWGPTIQMLFDPQADFENFGIPMILYEPKASFVGWLVLMIVISPSLQLLAAIFAAFLTLAVSPREDWRHLQ